jgi:hypothetical protein
MLNPLQDSGTRTTHSVRTGFAGIDQRPSLVHSEPVPDSGTEIGLVRSVLTAGSESQIFQRPGSDGDGPLVSDPSLQAQPGHPFVTGPGYRGSQAQLSHAEEVDSYFARTVQQQVDLIWSKGWQLKSDNPRAVQYLQQRLALIEQAAHRPLLAFFKAVTRHLVRDGESFLVKARGRKRADRPILPGLFVQVPNPVLAWFEMEPVTVELVQDPTTRAVVGYRQTLDGQQRDYPVSDVIHLVYRCRAGQVRGQSYLLPVIPDLRGYRIMEDRLLLLLQRYLFPLTLYRVGVGRNRRVHPREIEQVIAKLRTMPPGGTLVTAGDHDIQSLGAESKALRAEGYTRIFQNRLFAGLGMSELQFGLGQNINRNTGELLATELHERIKAWQQLIGIQFSFFLFNELLIEGGFDPLNRPEDRVELVFPPLTQQQRHESQWVQKWLNDGCTLEDYWQALGSGPVTDERWRRSRHWLVRVPLAEIQALRGLVPGQAGSDQSNAESVGLSELGLDPTPAQGLGSESHPLLPELQQVQLQLQMLQQMVQQLSQLVEQELG